MSNRCRKCGALINKKFLGSLALWCNRCRKEVDKEIKGEQRKGFDYYFEDYQKFLFSVRISQKRGLH